MPRNVRLAEVLWFAHYIEKVGTGTLDLIAGCQRADLPEPDFRQSGDEFLVTLWRDWLTEDVLLGLPLNERQRAAIGSMNHNDTITNAEYRALTGASDRSASRDLNELVVRGVLERLIITGRAASYGIVQTRHKPAKPATDVERRTRHKPAKPAKTATTVPRTRQKQKGKRLTKSSTTTKRKGSRR